MWKQDRQIYESAETLEPQVYTANVVEMHGCGLQLNR